MTVDGVFLFASKVIREPATVGVEQFDDLDRARIFYLDQEIGDAIKLVCVDIHEDPACCAIYSGPTVRDSGFNYVPHDRIVANGGKKQAESAQRGVPWKVGREVVIGVNEITRQHGVHPAMVAQWKR